MDIEQRGQPMASEVVTRKATPDDADELTRLRGVMLLALDISIDHSAEHAGRTGGADWHQACAAELRRRLADPGEAVAYVVDRPGEPGRLAASGIGLVRRGASGAVEVRHPVGLRAFGVHRP